MVYLKSELLTSKEEIKLINTENNSQAFPLDGGVSSFPIHQFPTGVGYRVWLILMVL